jgi:hypothetical protein
VNTPPTLDRFERALLQELRAHVADREPEATTTPATQRPHRRRRWAAGLAAAAAAATAYVVVSPGGPAVSPAYAVTQQDDGDVVVTIHRLEDAAGLAAALAERGIEAEVDFAPAQFDVGPEVEGELLYRYDVEMPDDIPQQLPPVERCGDPDRVFRVAEVSNGYVLTIPAGSVLLDQSVLRLTTATDADGDGYGLSAAYLVDGLECGFGSYGFGGR